jgi:hypothetical protein
MNIQSLKAELGKVERRRARLEKQIKSRTARQFAALPARVGLKSIDALILSLAPFASPRLRSRLGGNGADSPVESAAPGKRRGSKSKGTRYTSAVKAAVKAALVKGGKTAAQISQEYGPSVFSINDWKKQWGLAKTRKKK